MPTPSLTVTLLLYMPQSLEVPHLCPLCHAVDTLAPSSVDEKGKVSHVKSLPQLAGPAAAATEKKVEWRDLNGKDDAPGDEDVAIPLRRC